MGGGGVERKKGNELGNNCNNPGLRKGGHEPKSVVNGEMKNNLKVGEMIKNRRESTGFGCEADDAEETLELTQALNQLLRQ